MQALLEMLTNKPTMKKLLYLIVLLTALPMAGFCQEDLGPEDKNFHFIEVGLGTGQGVMRNTDATFTVAMSNGLGKYMANFLDYNLYFDKSGIKRHDISFKIGPYFQFNRYSYVAISSGVSLFMNSTDDNWVYRNGINYYENDYQLNIPIQAKINVGIYKGLCFGLKGSYNKMIDKDNSDRQSFHGFLSWGW